MTFAVSGDEYFKKKNLVTIYNKDYSSCSTIEISRFKLGKKNSYFMPRWAHDT